MFLVEFLSTVISFFLLLQHEWSGVIDQHNRGFVIISRYLWPPESKLCVVNMSMNFHYLVKTLIFTLHKICKEISEFIISIFFDSKAHLCIIGWKAIFCEFLNKNFIFFWLYIIPPDPVYNALLELKVMQRSSRSTMLECLKTKTNKQTKTNTPTNKQTSKRNITKYN